MKARTVKLMKGGAYGDALNVCTRFLSSYITTNKPLPERVQHLSKRVPREHALCRAGQVG